MSPFIGIYWRAGPTSQLDCANLLQWPEIIAASVGLPLEASSDIRGMWGRNREIARANEVQLPPQRFAETEGD